MMDGEIGAKNRLLVTIGVLITTLCPAARAVSIGSIDVTKAGGGASVSVAPGGLFTLDMVVNLDMAIFYAQGDLSASTTGIFDLSPRWSSTSPVGGWPRA